MYSVCTSVIKKNHTHIPHLLRPATSLFAPGSYRISIGDDSKAQTAYTCVAFCYTTFTCVSHNKISPTDRLGRVVSIPNAPLLHFEQIQTVHTRFLFINENVARALSTLYKNIQCGICIKPKRVDTHNFVYTRRGCADLFCTHFILWHRAPHVNKHVRLINMACILHARGP